MKNQTQIKLKEIIKTLNQKNKKEKKEEREKTYKTTLNRILKYKNNNNRSTEFWTWHC